MSQPASGTTISGGLNVLKSDGTYASPIDANGVVQAGSLDPQAIQYLKVTLTAAQVKALHATPVVLIAAPGAGKAVVIFDVQAWVNFNTTAFAAGSAVQILQNAIAVATTTAALFNSVSALLLQFAFPGIGTSQSNGAVNAATSITASGSEFTTGDSPIDIHLWYAVITA
jgi:hypothetical protein